MDNTKPASTGSIADDVEFVRLLNAWDYAESPFDQSFALKDLASYIDARQSVAEPIATFEGYVDGKPRIKWTGEPLPVGTAFYAVGQGKASDAEDAARYRWLREQDWFSSPLCVLSEPKKALTINRGLGADCPSRERLDAAIDAARAQRQGGSDGN